MGNCFCIDNYDRFHDSNEKNKDNENNKKNKKNEDNENNKKNNENLENDISLEEIIDNYNKNNIKPVENKFSFVRKNCIKFKI